MSATVLLVEDERKLRELVRSYLERAGLAVLSSSAMNCPASSTISISQRPRAAVAGSRRPRSVMVVMTAACAQTGEHAESLLILVSPLPG